MTQHEWRAMSVGELLDATFSMYRDRFRVLMPIGIFANLAVLGIIALAVVALFLIILGGRISINDPDPATLLPILLIFFAVILAMMFAVFYIGYLAQGAMVRLISEIYLGHPTRWQDAVKFTIKKMKIFFWALTLVGLVMIAWWVPLLLVSTGLIVAARNPGIGGVILLGLAAVVGVAGTVVCTLRYMLAPQVVMLENRVGWEALRRSSSLFSRASGRLVGMSFLLWFIPLPVNVAARLVPVIGLALQLIASLFLFPIPLIGMTLLYYDVRVRVEGFDLLVMAEELGLPPSTPDPEGAPAGGNRP